MLQHLLDFIFPRQCLVCKVGGGYFCGRCRPLLRLAAAPDDLNVMAGFDYDDPAIKKAIWKLKYSGLTSLASELAELLSERLAEDIADLKHFSGREKIVVTPIPLSAKRRRERGYNQSALLAKALAKKWPDTLEYSEILEKIRETPPQASLKNRAARLDNLRGAFKLRPGAVVTGRTIIVIDDVVTTGATLAEARRALKESRAEVILGAALAHRE